MKKIALLLLTQYIYAAFAQEAQNSALAKLTDGTTYVSEASATFSDGNGSPLWMTSNRHGLSSIERNSGYVRSGIFRSASIDSLRRWRIGYGADFVVPFNFDSDFIIQQLYADIEHKGLRMTIGSKERPMELKNNRLSSGSLTQSINARPIPQVRIECPDFWTIPNTKGWIAVKGHLSYGMFTDSRWIEDFTHDARQHAIETGSALPHYYKNALYHSKAGYLRIGNDEKCPFSVTGGLEMCAQFGGEAWNVGKRLDDTSDFNGDHIKGKTDFMSFIHAFFPSGNDASDGDFKNVEGNHLGSWHLSATYKAKGWSVRGYAEHFFEDHSQMFFEYWWKDMLWGVEAQLPKNPIVTSLVVEYLYTKDQTGGLYHDKTDALKVQTSGIDNYYNHNIYGWQHWGQAIGSPLLLSPVYNKNGRLEFYHNRVSSCHVGIEGQPLASLSYRVLYSHLKSWGTYYIPLTDPQSADFLLAECTYKPTRLKHWEFTAAYGINAGELLGRSAGGQFTIRKKGIIR